MQIYKILLIAIISLPVFSTTARGQLVITELMQSNVTGIIDDLNDFPDSWVELYNPGDENEYLEQYSIGIKKKIDKAYNLPAMEIKPGEYIVIYCDKGASGLHTSFRLESNKAGEVYLFKDRNQIQMVEHPAFPAPDIAYGQDPDTGEWGYEFVATPGAPNTGGLCYGSRLLGSPKFNVLGGVRTEGFFLRLSKPDGSPKEAAIHYTFDGSNPTSQSAILAEGDSLEINKTTVVRAALFLEGWLSPLPATQSYIFPDHEIDLPVISIVMDRNHLYDTELGILKNPYEDWRRPANFEYFETSGATAVINQAGECKVQGRSSRQWELKALNIYANKRFGEKQFNHEFFPDMRPGVTEFKSLNIRRAGNDFYEAYMRDAVVQEHVGNAMELDYMAVTSCVVFINGEYNGIAHIRERSDEDLIATHYDGLEDIDMVENWSELETGTMDSIEEFQAFFKEPDHTAQEYEERMDVKEFMDIQLVNLYYNNCDFPGNNMILWRPQAEGGKWREILKDTDYAMGLKFSSAKGNPFDYPTLTWLHDNTFPGANNWGNYPSKTLLFRNLENLQEIREEFTERALMYMGDFLNARETVKTIEKRFRAIEKEWAHHYRLYKSREGVSETSLKENVEYMKAWIQGRDTFFPLHFAEFYDLGAMGEIHVLQPKEMDGAPMTINGYSLKSGEFTGFLPVGKEIEIHVDTPDDRVTIKGWEISVLYADEDESTGDEGEPTTLTRRIAATSRDYSFVYPKGVKLIIMRPILDLSMIKSDLTVEISAGCENIPVEGITVEIQDAGSNLESTAITDKDGFAVFKEVPFGTYALSISDPAHLFNPYRSEDFVVKEDMSMTARLTEIVAHPSELKCNVSEAGPDLIKLELSWGMEGYELPDTESFFGYEFNITLDGQYHGSTPALEYEIEGISNQTHSVGLFAITPYGSTTREINLTTEIAGIEIGDEKSETDYYLDLGGTRVDGRHLLPGLYIRRLGNGQTEKILIK